MKIVDLNVLIYATDQQSRRHTTAREFLDQAMQSVETVGLPTAVTVGYIRLVTNPRVMNEPMAVARAVSIVSGWLGRANVTVPQPGRRHYDVLSELLAPLGSGGNLVSDAHLAALAIEHGAELWSFDSDFGRFGGVDWHQPPTGEGPF